MKNVIEKEIQNFLEGINEKKPKMWEKLFIDYYSPLCNFAVSFIKDRDIAKDIVQETIIKIWEKPVNFQLLPELNKYLYKSVYNNCIKYIRDQNIKDKNLKDIDLYDYEDPEVLNQVVLEEVIRKLRLIIDALPSRQKEVMLMSLQKMKNEEIGKELSISVNTVKKYKKQAYVYIRNQVKRDIFLLTFLIFSI